MKSTNQNVFVLTHARQESASACMACSKKSVCPAASRGPGIPQPQQMVIRAGKSAYEANDRFDGIYIVRSGFFKSYSINAEGEMQVTGFHMPAEFFGMDGIETGHYKEHVEALDTSSVCKIPLELLANSGSPTRRTGQGEAGLHYEAGSEPENMMMALVKLMSRTISRDRNMLFSLGKMSARRRFSTFLLDVSERMSQSGYSRSEFKLCMSRTDIANYLCLALETVSRLFTQLQVEGIIKVDRRDVQILNIEALSNDEPELKKLRKAG